MKFCPGGWEVASLEVGCSKLKGVGARWGQEGRQVRQLVLN